MTATTTKSAFCALRGFHEISTRPIVNVLPTLQWHKKSLFRLICQTSKRTLRITGIASVWLSLSDAIHRGLYIHDPTAKVSEQVNRNCPRNLILQLLTPTLTPISSDSLPRISKFYLLLC